MPDIAERRILCIDEIVALQDSHRANGIGLLNEGEVHGIISRWAIDTEDREMLEELIWAYLNDPENSRES